MGENDLLQRLQEELEEAAHELPRFVVVDGEIVWISGELFDDER